MAAASFFWKIEQTKSNICLLSRRFSPYAARTIPPMEIVSIERWERKRKRERYQEAEHNYVIEIVAKIVVAPAESSPVRQT